MIEKYIRVYDDVLPETLCKNAIKMFEERTDLEDWDRDGRPNFKQWNLTAYLEENSDSDWGLIHNAFIESANKYVHQYMEDCECRQFFPVKSTIEQSVSRSIVLELMIDLIVTLTWVTMHQHVGSWFSSGISTMSQKVEELSLIR